MATTCLRSQRIFAKYYRMGGQKGIAEESRKEEQDREKIDKQEQGTVYLVVPSDVLQSNDEPRFNDRPKQKEKTDEERLLKEDRNNR